MHRGIKIVLEIIIFLFCVIIIWSWISVLLHYSKLELMELAGGIQENNDKFLSQELLESYAIRLWAGHWMDASMKYLMGVYLLSW